MQDTRIERLEAAQDLYFGQIVIIWARWFLILAGIIRTFWTASTNRSI